MRRSHFLALLKPSVIELSSSRFESNTFTWLRWRKLYTFFHKSLAVLLLILGNATWATEIGLINQGGVYTIPIRINGVITLNFIVDSGASEVQIPADVVLTLIRTGTLTAKDFLPGHTSSRGLGERDGKKPKPITEALDRLDRTNESR